MNNRYMDKEIENKLWEVKYALLRVASSWEAHWQGKVYLKVLTMILKHTLSETEHSTCYEPHFKA